MIHFLCPFCRKSLKARDSDSGKKCRCNSCSLLVDIPGQRVEVIRSIEEAESINDEAEQGDGELTETTYLEQTPSMPLLKYGSELPVSGGIRAVRIFLVGTGVVYTAVVTVYIVLIVQKFKFLEDASFFIGMAIGAWIGIIILLTFVYLIAEIVVALRGIRYALEARS